MTYTISKEFTFSASHQLSTLPDGHPCSRLHGHNYTVRVELGSDGMLDEQGMVVDYGRLKPFGEWLDGHVDHRHLNDLIPWPPTAEHLARWLADVVAENLDLASVRSARITGVGVSETPKTWAWWRP